MDYDSGCLEFESLSPCEDFTPPGPLPPPIPMPSKVSATSSSVFAAVCLLNLPSEGVGVGVLSASDLVFSPSSFFCALGFSPTPPTARGTPSASRSFSSTDIVFLVVTDPRQMATAALQPSQHRPKREKSLTYPIPQRKERGMSEPVVQAGRSCLFKPHIHPQRIHWKAELPTIS